MSNEENTYKLAGRPAKSPRRKVGTPVRCLVTPPVAAAILESSDNHGIPRPKRGAIPSDILRLAIYNLLDKEGLIQGLEEDPSWESLRYAGLV